MKLFHKEADYAVRTLIFLALREEDGYFSATALAREIGLPVNFLRRICSTMVRAEILSAKEGAGGGVRLEKNPAEVNVLEIMELFRGDLELSDCTFRKKLCSNRGTCPLRRRILGIEDTVRREFRAITIQDLINDVLGQSELVGIESPAG